MPAQLQINQGPQDALLYDNSKSFFNPLTYQRTSNFQMELKDVTSNTSTQPTFGGTQRFVIPKAADLLGPVDLLVEFDHQILLGEMQTGFEYAEPASETGDIGKCYRHVVSWIESLGFAMIDTIEFKVGLSSVETITGDQLYLMNELYKDDDHRLGTHTILKTGRPSMYFTGLTLADGSFIPEGENEAYDNGGRAIVSGHKVSGGTNKHVVYDSKKLIIPLGFFFTKGPGHYFPLAAIAGCNDIEVIVKFRPIKELLVAKTDRKITANKMTDDNAAALPDISKLVKIKHSKLRCHYIHVTGPEATYLMNKEQVRLMQPWARKEVVFKATCGGTSGSGRVTKTLQIDLPFMHPVKELLFIIRRVDELSGEWGTGTDPSDTNQLSRNKNRFAFHGGNRDPNIENENYCSLGDVGEATFSAWIDVKSVQVKLNSNSRHPDLEAWSSDTEAKNMQLDRHYMEHRLMPMYHSNAKSPYEDIFKTERSTHSILGTGPSLEFFHGTGTQGNTITDSTVWETVSSKGYSTSIVKDSTPAGTDCHYRIVDANQTVIGDELLSKALSEKFDRKQIFAFPFSISPEANQPSGAVNFSKVHNATLDITYVPECNVAADRDVEFQIDVFALHYNWLMIKDGAATMSFS
jgi:hypothetical protein